MLPSTLDLNWYPHSRHLYGTLDPRQKDRLANFASVMDDNFSPIFYNNMQFQQSSVITIIMNYHDNLSLNIHLQKCENPNYDRFDVISKRNIFITEKCWGYVPVFL